MTTYIIDGFTTKSEHFLSELGMLGEQESIQKSGYEQGIRETLQGEGYFFL